MTTERGALSSKPLALITGPTNGIGLELARFFARDRHPLVLVARSAVRLDEVAAELLALGAPETTPMAIDLADPAAPAAIDRELSGRALRVGILVNNAGYGLLAPFAESDRGDELKMIQLNVAALVELTKRLLPSILEAGRDGGILNVASTAAFQAGPNMAVYYATKAFVLSFTEAIAEELAGRTRVTCLCPGPTPTGFQDRAGFGDGVALTGGLLPKTSAAAVARVGYAGFRRGRRIVIPGAVNKSTAWGVRLIPRRAAAKIAGALQKKRQR